VVPARRTFTLLDAIVIIAATATGFAWVRSIIDEFDWPDSWTYEVWGLSDYVYVIGHLLACVLRPLLAIWTLAILGLRFLEPRPPIYKLAYQPGVTACGSVVLVLACEFLRYLAIAVAMAKGAPWHHPFLVQGSFGADFYRSGISEGAFHYAVVVAWGLLLVMRRWRPQKSWIDRTGRAIGVLWLIQLLSSLVSSVVSIWQIETP
jgi:hypothetical protein